MGTYKKIYAWTDRFIFIAEKEVKKGEEVSFGPLKGTSNNSLKPGKIGIATCEYDFPVYTGILTKPVLETIPSGTPLYAGNGSYLTLTQTGKLVGYAYFCVLKGETEVRFIWDKFQARPKGLFKI